MNKKTYCSIFTIFFAIAIMSCGGKGHSDHAADHNHDEAVHGMGKEYTSTYVCPMHCEGSGSAIAGTCPVCGMDYVLLNEHMGDGHKHDKGGDNHQH